MATAKTGKQAAASAKLGEKDLMTRLTDAGEEALQRLADLPGGQRALNAFNDLRSNVDELAKKVRGIDALEARVAKLEKEITELKRTRRASAKRAAARKRPSSGSTSS
jgi:DNA-binding PadR family transcriptional regulator